MSLLSLSSFCCVTKKHYNAGVPAKNPLISTIYSFSFAVLDLHSCSPVLTNLPDYANFLFINLRSPDIDSVTIQELSSTKFIENQAISDLLAMAVLTFWPEEYI